jgi:hypothetical protein
MSSNKKTTELRLSDEQIKELEKLTGVKMSKLVVEAEPFESPPMGTTVLGKIYTDPRTQVVARVNARLAT